MNIQRKNSAHHFRMQSEREQTLEVDGRIAVVETGRVAKGVEERVELFVGGSTVEELEVYGRVASVEAGRVAKG